MVVAGSDTKEQKAVGGRDESKWLSIFFCHKLLACGPCLSVLLSNNQLMLILMLMSMVCVA